MSCVLRSPFASWLSLSLFAPALFLLFLDRRAQAQPRGGAMSFHVSSATFSPGETIPKNFTCDGPDVSPELRWSNAPAGTQSFAN
jgi:hypothetical protein